MEADAFGVMREIVMAKTEDSVPSILTIDVHKDKIYLWEDNRFLKKAKEFVEIYISHYKDLGYEMLFDESRKLEDILPTLKSEFEQFQDSHDFKEHGKTIDGMSRIINNFDNEISPAISRFCTETPNPLFELSKFFGHGSESEIEIFENDDRDEQDEAMLVDALESYVRNLMYPEYYPDEQVVEFDPYDEKANGESNVYKVIKPECKIIGHENVDIENIMSISAFAAQTLIENGKRKEAAELLSRAAFLDYPEDAMEMIFDYVIPVESEINKGIQQQ